MADYIERLAVSSDKTTSIYKIVADGQSFTRTCVDRRYYMITDTALASGCLIDISNNNPKDEINIYVQVNST